MNEFKLKEQMCEIGRRLYNKGFAAANDGNITIRLNEREVLCTPTMVSKGYMKCDDICKVDYEGKQLAGTRKRSSEVLLHLAVYKARPGQRLHGAADEGVARHQETTRLRRSALPLRELRPVRQQHLRARLQ